MHKTKNLIKKFRHKRDITKIQQDNRKRYVRKKINLLVTLIVFLMVNILAAKAYSNANNSIYVLKLDGNGDYIEVPSHQDLSLTRNTTTGDRIGMTIYAEIRPDVLDFPATDGTTDKYVNFIGKNDPKGDNREWVLRMYNKNTTNNRSNWISSYIFSPNKSLGVGAQFTNSNLGAGTLIKVTMVVDHDYVYIYNYRKMMSCRTYSNIIPIKSGCYNDANRPIDYQYRNAPMRIGTDYLHSFFLGGIREVRKYNRPFSLSEVSELVNGTFADTKDLVFWHNYRLGNAIDQSGRGHNGILYGNAHFELDKSQNTADKFDIKELYQTASNSREWYSTWDNGYARSWSSSSNDIYDPEFVTQYKGSGSYRTDGNGTLKISGSSPRMYVVDGNQTKSWRNVEITVYGQRVSDTNIVWGGIMGYVRTNHMIDANYCDARGYGGRFRYDGNIDYEKETKHGVSNGYAQVASKTYWPGGMVKNKWIGYKYIVYDLSNDNVKLELWMDTTDGANGGSWNEIDEFIDNGNNFGVGNTPCNTGINPALRLNSSNNRLGSETDKPNLVVYFRSDGVNSDGLWFKKASIREIMPSMN